MPWNKNSGYYAYKPFIGPMMAAYSGYRSGGPSVGYTRSSMGRSVVSRSRPRAKPRTFGTRVKKVIDRTLETKMHSTNASATLLHGNIYSYNLTAQVVQGTGEGNRIGDQIELKRLRYNFFVNTPTTEGAYAYRVLIYYSGEEYNPGTWSTSGPVYAELFLPNALTNTGFTAITNPKAITVIHDEIFDVNSLIETTADISSRALNISLNKKFPYQAAGSVYGKKVNLYMTCIPYVVGGSGGSTACGTITANWALHYKDA